MQASHCKGRYYREFAYVPLRGESPAEFLRLKHTPVKDDKDLMDFVKTYYSRPGMYVSVYAFSSLTVEGTVDYKTAIVDRVYFDFDDEKNPQKAVDGAAITLEILERHGIHGLPYFSGRKGVGVYVDFEPVNIRPEYKKEVLARFWDLVLETVREESSFALGIILETMDSQVRGDIARVSRLPNTRHASGLYCIPLTISDLEGGIDHIKNIAMNPRRDFDLAAAIKNNVTKNKVMPTILRSCEKDVAAGRIKTEKLMKLREQYLEEQAKRTKKKGYTPHLTEKDIEHAKSVPLSNFLGHNKLVCCPFHHDEHPSLSINHEENLWYCFGRGCGKGGTVIDFVMEAQGLDFKSAVLRLLGREVGAPESKGKPPQRKPLRDSAHVKTEPAQEERKETAEDSVPLRNNVPTTNNQSPPSMKGSLEEKPRPLSSHSEPFIPAVQQAEVSALSRAGSSRNALPETIHKTPAIAKTEKSENSTLQGTTSPPTKLEDIGTIAQIPESQTEFSPPTLERGPSTLRLIYSTDIKPDTSTVFEVLRGFIEEWYGDGVPGHPEDPQVRNIFVQELLVRCERGGIAITQDEAKKVVELTFQERGWI